MIAATLKVICHPAELFLSLSVRNSGVVILTLASVYLLSRWRTKWFKRFFFIRSLNFFINKFKFSLLVVKPQPTNYFSNINLCLKHFPLQFHCIRIQAIIVRVKRILMPSLFRDSFIIFQRYLKAFLWENSSYSPSAPNIFLAL